MARYTVHVPVSSSTARPDRAEALERAVFVRDGWSWAAFVFGPLWMLWNRHWITGLLTLIVMGMLLASTAVFPVSEATKFGAIILVMLLWGLEGSSLRRFALTRAGYSEEGLVVGGNLDTLEQRFFAEMAESAQGSAREESTTALPPASAPGFANTRSLPVLGLFPDSRKHS